MIVLADVQYHIACPGCTKKAHRADQLNVGQKTIWTCDSCYNEFSIVRINYMNFETILTGRKQTPVTVTLRSITQPPITLKLNTWKYADSQQDSPEEYAQHQRYFYNTHTCPTNWTRQIEHIEFQGDDDPHGLFEFVSVEDGHFVDPNDLSYDARVQRGEAE